VKYAVYVPNCRGYGSARDLLDFAERTEAAGWDGFFTWDTLTLPGELGNPVVDSTVTLGAIAASTKKIAFGALVTALGRRRPWKLAREYGALSELAGGRVIMGVGVGSGHDFVPFPREVETAAERAALFTDAVELIRQMLSGSRIEWTQSEQTAQALGEEQHKLSLDPFFPAPATPIPLWGGASIQRESDQKIGAFRRAARLLDGLVPVGNPLDSQQPITLDEFSRSVEYAFDGQEPREGFDLVAFGCAVAGNSRSPSDPARFEAEGATWWLEGVQTDGTPEDARRIIDAGPPRA
jgi:alkanesulfonate monooxygenase SsuD/methylene tetrahydromethanopterin reductase-like flavin-dependent oxidoreductase (luciferase family)